MCVQFSFSFFFSWQRTMLVAVFCTSGFFNAADYFVSFLLFLSILSGFYSSFFLSCQWTKTSIHYCFPSIRSSPLRVSCNWKIPFFLIVIWKKPYRTIRTTNNTHLCHTSICICCCSHSLYFLFSRSCCYADLSLFFLDFRFSSVCVLFLAVCVNKKARLYTFSSPSQGR